MPLILRKRYMKRHVIGGAGLFDTISGLVKRLITSNAAKRIASTAFNASKDVAKEIGKKAVDVGKSVAIDAGKRLVDKAAAKMFTRKEPKAITQETRDILAKLSSVAPNATSTNINNLMMGNGLKKSSNAISIQDLVRKLNGGGMKVV